MSFNNIPPNGFPALPDIEDLEAVEKDVTTLKTNVAGLTEDVTDLNAQKANQITIAPFFNSETSYDVGDLVYYNGLSYRCTNAHEGEWDVDDFAGTTIANEIDTLKSGLIELSFDIVQNTTSTVVSAESVSNASVSASKSGYTPLGIVGHDISDTIVIVTRMAVNQSTGNINYSLYNPTQGDKTITSIAFEVLYKKVTA